MHEFFSQQGNFTDQFSPQYYGTLHQRSRENLIFVHTFEKARYSVDITHAKWDAQNDCIDVSPTLNDSIASSNQGCINCVILPSGMGARGEHGDVFLFSNLGAL